MKMKESVNVYGVDEEFTSRLSASSFTVIVILLANGLGGSWLQYTISKLPPSKLSELCFHSQPTQSFSQALRFSSFFSRRLSLNALISFLLSFLPERSAFRLLPS